MNLLRIKKVSHYINKIFIKMKISFNINDGELRHNCKGHREGDEIVFTCPVCTDYERRINIHTGKMKTRATENPEILHIGTFQPAGWDMDSASGLN
jgi:hypothetical protein